MKKIKYLIIYLLMAITIFASTAKVASFNALRLGQGKTKDYKTMAKVLTEFDLIGVEEVMTRKGLKRLVREMNRINHKKWDCFVDRYPTGTRKYKEYFGYIWRKDKVKFLGNGKYYPDRRGIFIRDPYGADFKIDKMDFTFVLNHLKYGKSIKERRREAANLHKVYHYFQDYDKKENDIIMAGDFNLPATDRSFRNLLKTDRIIYALNPKSNKTTLGHKGLANSYDNMFLSKRYTTEFKGVGGAKNFAKGRYKKMRRTVSDHLPIYIILDTSRDDD